MLHHISIGVADVVIAARFYDEVLGKLGYKRVMDFLPKAVAYGEDAPVFWVQVPREGMATHGIGAHVAFAAKTRKAVDAFHEMALRMGATDNGAPGLRPDYGPEYYGAFVIDPDGNRIEAVVLPQGRAKPDSRKPAKPKRAAAKTKRPAKKKTAARKTAAKKTAVKKTSAKRASATRRKPAGRKAGAPRRGRPRGR
jgi:catechol 2,3-dioxygenase-like lactoylglutathione lyase family enzyme